MLNFNELDIDVNYALQMHKNHVCKLIENKLNKTINRTNLNEHSNELLKEFIQSTVPFGENNLYNNIVKIICSKKEDLNKINQYFIEFVNSKSLTDFDGENYMNYINTRKAEKPKKEKIHSFFNRLNSVFSYDTFGDESYSKYKLTENLKVRSCVYCNRTYTITQYKSDGSNLMNPQLDHWFPKSKYPLLQMSFFNLIPSCDVCNSRVKRNKEFDLNLHVHPYDDSYEELKFTYEYNASLDSYRVVFWDNGVNNKVKNTFEYIYVHEMYIAHIPELKDLIKIKEAYGDVYMKKLKDSFPNAKITDEDRFKLAFGVELDPRKFHLNPLSKFKFDILKELKII